MGPALQYFMTRPGPDPRGVALEPFVHQVGGHSCILRFDSGTVCKVLIRREHDVYHSLPAELRPFTPQYRGVVLVRVEQSKTGSILLIAHPAGTNHVSVAGVCCPKRNRGTSWGREGERVGDSAGSPKIRDETLEALKQPYMLRLPLSGCPPRTQDLLAQLNPWARRLYQYRVERLREEGEREFLLLEDLTQGFRLPCVLDVKLGCRQHGEGASLEKQRSQSKKCEQSTSAELGMRVCGMQVFQLDSDQMIFLNKYLGRSLSHGGLSGVLGQFFHSGAWLRRGVIAGVLTRLGELREIVARQKGYRFYSSSLLILYEGAEPCLVDSVRFDVRLIDFAHTSSPLFSSHDGVTHGGSDAGLLLGLRSLQGMLGEILRQDQEGREGLQRPTHPLLLLLHQRFNTPHFPHTPVSQM
ncbi:inositol hexakisphosphate kinase 2-like [Acipenser oxyrinchus oxyrinchus]|uniref:Kinase n=1 Tax=Acipenser oxyrinchus oxyrinchus TaxID=40147 RepID=A0AAD8FSA8_ACIOX|nr:inositol hexakisphosphate kinase 2-like [Acipenser oxyrinchus oxyrinchus]